MPSRQQAIIWTNDDIVYWLMHAFQGLNELKYSELSGTNACTNDKQFPRNLTGNVERAVLWQPHASFMAIEAYL